MAGVQRYGRSVLHLSAQEGRRMRRLMGSKGSCRSDLKTRSTPDLPLYKNMIKYSLKEAENVWLISDTHFDHTNIIKYCNRPFVSVKEMNEYILHNWFRTVKVNDAVYFLGDMAFGRDSRNPRWWAAQLRGRITWVKGSHDKGVRPTSVVPNIERVVLQEFIICAGLKFMLIHDAFGPAVNGWEGWVIHGHNHNNRPHIDNRFGRKHVNVSVEVIDYEPVSLAHIVQEVRVSENS